MIHIQQPKDSFLCGHCCLAMITKTPLEKIIKLIGHEKGTKTKELVKALKKLGFKTTGKKLITIKKDMLVPSLCILKIKYKNTSNWHWVVFKDGFIYDPSPKSKKPIFAPDEFYFMEKYDKSSKISSYINVFKNKSNKFCKLPQEVVI